jgi:Bacterial regulatory proteins, luxR family
MSPYRQLSSLGLTEREAEVFYWITEGKTNPEIAIILGTSLTIKAHAAKPGYSAKPTTHRTAAPSNWSCPSLSKNLPIPNPDLLPHGKLLPARQPLAEFVTSWLTNQFYRGSACFRYTTFGRRRVCHLRHSR